MLRQLLKTSLPLIIYNPPGVRDRDYCAVCSESGALPVFDTEFSSSRESIDFIKELSHEDFNFGIRVSVKNDDIISYIKENVITNCDTVIYYYDTPDELNGFEIGKSPYTSMIEVTDININEKLDAIEPHGLVLRGHEAPGKVSLYTSFILQQWYTMNSGYAYFVHGGVGYFTAPGMFAAGASGVVLDSQLFLAEEAPVSSTFKQVLKKLEERDSVVLEDGYGIRRRFFSKLGTKIVREMKQKSESGYYRSSSKPLYDEIKENVVFMNNDQADPMQGLFYLGQDAAIAQYFARKSSGLVDMVHSFFEHVNHQLSLVDEFDPVHKDSALSLEHGTKYPLMQGPMANISDNPDFAKMVSEAGALPFFAMGNLPVHLADEMVKKGKKNPVLATGMIGVKAFNRYLEEHMEIVKKHKVPFALFAGGIPSQVKELEEAGTKTYLHTPSRPMLENAIASGCTRFILEGHEAGGHIGFLTSMTLWELALEAIHEMTDEQVKDFRIIFAGGIGTPCASHFISGMSALFARRGCKIGMQVGTPYLFTKEIVETGAITQLYQDIICKENKTIVIGDTVGLHARTVESPFSKRIIENEETRVRDKMPLNERKERFEDDNIGSLLISAKTFCPDFSDPGDVKLVYYDEKDQYEKGNFLTGDLLTCYDTAITIDDVHNTIMHNKQGLFENLNRLEILFGEKGTISDDIAVIGMGCIYPQSKNPDELWKNILAKKYTIKEMPVERFDPELYFDEDKKAEDKSYTKIAGHVDDFVFDHDKYGYTEAEAKGISRSQQMVLEAAFQAVEDAGYLGEDKKLPANRTAVVLGTCLTSELNSDLQVKYYYPEFKYYLDHIDEFKQLSNADKKKLLADFKEGLGQGHTVESPDGVVLSLEASRIAKHLGLRGANYTIDAACASSLAALDAARKELLSGTHDVAVVGGVNTNLAPESFVGFCQMGALSGKGSYPFDQRAEGFVLGEGAGVIVIKRMKDALRDGDTIHGILRGIGSSSDGKGKAIAAPNPDGQFFAFERCFEDLDGAITPDDIGFIEAHGTSTLMGDYAEIQTLRNIYGKAPSLGFSSVKSQIGHLLGGAGLAGVIKAVLTLKNRTLAPNANYEKLSSRFDLSGTNLFVVKDQQPWEIEGNKPRRAGVSSFGFGGINYHCIFEEMSAVYTVKNRTAIFDPSRNYDHRRIVIAGMGVALPGAQSPDEMWDAIRESRNVLSDIPEDRFHRDYYVNEDDEWFQLPEVKAGIVDMSTIDTKSFRMTPNTARTVDRSQFLGLHCAKQALEQSGLIKKLEKGNRTAVILGTMSGEKLIENIIRTRLGLIQRILEQSKAADTATRIRIADKLVAALKDRYMKNNEDTVPGLLSNIVSGRIANFFGCNGANYIVDASSASSAVSMRLAMMGLRSGEYENVITGGIDSNLTPPQIRALRAMGMLAREGAVIFDKNGNGINLSEGGALFVMTTLKNAREQNMPVLGELNVIGISGLAKDNMLLPSESAYVESMEQAYRLQPVAKRDIDYVDVYGSGYMLFDQMEYQALNRIYKKDLPFGNSKPEFGYFRSSNPAVVLAKMLLMNREQAVPAVRTYSAETSIVKDTSPLKAVPSAMELNRPWRHFAANLFGIGGNHGHMIMSTPPLAIQQQAQVSRKPEVPAVAMSVQRETVNSHGSYSVLNGTHATALLSGQGSQHSGMMKELYDKDARVRKIMDRGNEIFMITRGYDLLEIMFGDSDKINLTENTQPAIFISTAAVYDVLKDAGLNPKYFIGHSLGEFSALYCAGLLSFDDTMQLLLKRSELMKEAANKVAGRIMVVFKNWTETEELIKKSGIQDIYVANKNSEAQTSISGKESSILEFSAYLKSTNTMYKALSLSGAFHSPLFDSAAAKLREHMKSVNFNNVDYSRVISNVTAKPYPQNQDEVKDLLAQQLVSPVEFVNSVHYAFNQGAGSFIEAGPNRILINLLKNISLDIKTAIPTVDPKAGEAKSLDDAVKKIAITGSRVLPAPAPSTIEVNIKTQEQAMPQVNYSEISKDKEFNDFLNEKKDHVNRLLFEEYQKYQQQKAFEENKKFGFYTGPIVVAGMSIGLPGSARDVFGEDNFDRILRGENCIELLSKEERDLLLDKNITKVHKKPDGSASFVTITEEKDVIHLSGKPGRFNQDDYGIEFKNDISDALCIAAGLEALRDAGIPMVPNRKNTSTGGVIIDGFALPVEMQGTTGVIRTSILAGLNSVIDEVTKYLSHKHVNGPFKDFEKLYYTLMEQIRDEQLKEQITDWFFELKSQMKKSDYAFDKNFVFKLGFMGAAQFAQLVKAKGPNTQSNAACSSTTQAVAIAEDWIRMGRCERVIIIGSESATPGQLSPWLHSIFLALGAGTIKQDITEAAKPFDANRNGTIIGSGAVSMIIERADTVHARGLRGQAEVLGTHMGNSAFHGTSIDVNHVTEEMKKGLTMIEARHGLQKEEYTRSLVFMSHETYTPAKGGSASAEVKALRESYPEHYKNILISNTKGFTGHTLGGGIEDPVLIKALQKGMVPPIANLKEIPAEFADLRFSRGETGTYEYGMHFAAGFGSQLAMALFRRIDEASTVNNRQYYDWLKRISGYQDPELIIENRTLRIKQQKETLPAAKPVPGPAAEIQLPEPGVVQAAAAPTIGRGHLTENLKSVIAEQTGYTVDMLEDDLDLEADLGIDTVKQVEIFGRISSHFNLEVPEDLKLSDMNTIAKLVDYIASKVGPGEAPAVPQVAAAASSMGAASITQDLKSVIAEQTGYTVDMLEDDLDLEADLGIDTVKQVEIFGRISSHFNLEVPEDLKLSDMNTIAKLVDYIASKVGPGEAPAVPQVAAAASSMGAASITQDLKSVIAEQTGYTVDMLEDDLDLEADLGIDTVKQVEIFGRISSHFNLEVPEDLKLSDMNTIAKLVDYIASKVEPVQSPAASTAQSPAAVTAYPSDTIVKDLKSVIAEQTGYTVDMLEDDLDLEADLGIDTVKQVEIFGRISAHFNLEVPEDLKLSDMNTIARLSEYIAAKMAPAEAPVAAQAQAEATGTVEAAAPSMDDVHRFIIELAELDDVEADSDFSGRTFIMTRDGQGFADKLTSMITKKAGKVVSIGMDEKADYSVDLTKPDELEKKLEEIVKKHGDINSLIHLAPIDYVINGADKSDDCIRASVKSFFVIVKTLHEKLRSDRSIIATPAFNSVVFPYGDAGKKMYPVFGAVGGMSKTIQKEFGSSRVRIVDFAVSNIKKSMTSILKNFEQELLYRESRVEVGYDKDRRFGLSIKTQNPDNNGSLVKDGDSIIVTGGAAGITFEILKKLTASYKDLDLHILDISDIYSLNEEFKGSSVAEKDVLEVVKSMMQGAKPLEIKQAVTRVMRTRQVLDNMEYLKQQGAKVTYHVADVTSLKAIKNALKDVKSFNGIIHAAGMEQSQFIEKKALEQFNLVFDVKASGALNLLKFAEKKDYDFFIGFSSVAARFGNEGQIDYSGGNEMLGKLIHSEKIKHPERKYKVFDWTAWSGAGMAMNETVRKVLEMRGTVFLPLERGIDFFMNELKDTATTEAIFAGMDDSFSAGQTGPDTSVVAPFLDSAIHKDSSSARFVRTITLERDLFMSDHTKDGIPLFLGATGIETMAEAAAQLTDKGKLVTELRDFHIPYGIKILKGRPKEIIVDAERDGDAVKCAITSQFKNPRGVIAGDTTLHYKGTYLFGDKLPKQPVIDVPEANRIEYEGDFQDIIYHPERLFMDGVFRTVQNIRYFDGSLLVSAMKHNVSGREFFAGIPRPDFLLDVVLLDAMFQTGGIYEMLSEQVVVLPYMINSMKVYAKPEYGNDYLCLTRKLESNEETNVYSLQLIDMQGRVYVDIERFDMVRVTKFRKDQRIDGVFRIA